MVNVLTIKTTILDLLKNNNTNTSSYNISNGLEKKVCKISGSNAEKQPVLNIHYPAVFVEVKAESDEHYLMGNTSNRQVEIEIDIVPVVDHGVSRDNARESSDDELIKVTQNIQDLLRNNIKLNNTVDECIIASTNYEAEYDEDTYNSQARIALLIKKRG
jgi:hypothetical protein